jgi:hypothetical protein
MFGYVQDGSMVALFIFLLLDSIIVVSSVARNLKYALNLIQILTSRFSIDEVARAANQLRLNLDG